MNGYLLGLALIVTFASATASCNKKTSQAIPSTRTFSGPGGTVVVTLDAIGIDDKKNVKVRGIFVRSGAAFLSRLSDSITRLSDQDRCDFTSSWAKPSFQFDNGTRQLRMHTTVKVERWICPKIELPQMTCEHIPIKLPFGIDVPGKFTCENRNIVSVSSSKIYDRLIKVDTIIQPEYNKLQIINITDPSMDILIGSANLIHELVDRKVHVVFAATLSDLSRFDGAADVLRKLDSIDVDSISFEGSKSSNFDISTKFSVIVSPDVVKEIFYSNSGPSRQ